MYDHDSFFTLTTLGQTGLLLLSLVMFGLLVWGMARMRGHWVVLAVLALAGFYLFVWLSPQIYYTYYLILFDGLPLQIVVGQAPSPLHILKILTFSGAQNLSVHGQSVLGWAMLTAPYLAKIFRKCRDAAN